MKKNNFDLTNIDESIIDEENLHSSNLRKPFSSKTMPPIPLEFNSPPLNMTKTNSTTLEEKEEEKDFPKNKTRTSTDLRKLFIETKSLIQFPLTGFNTTKSFNLDASVTSLTSLDCFSLKNPYDLDIIEEEISNDYKTISKIGQGYHALVKKVEKLSTREFFAAKILRVVDDEIEIAIENEFKTLQSLDHKYILKAYELIKKPSMMIVITEYVNCNTLTSFFKKSNGDISEKIALSILAKTLISVDYLHKRGICHRDISPKNILISEDLSIFKLIDFGVCKKFNEKDKIIEMITPTGVAEYRAPEIFKGWKFDEKIDEWNCGHIFYELLIGKHLTSKSLYKLIKNKKLFEIEKKLSKETKMILEGLLELFPKRRITADCCLKKMISFVDFVEF